MRPPPKIDQVRTRRLTAILAPRGSWSTPVQVGGNPGASMVVTCMSLGEFLEPSNEIGNRRHTPSQSLGRHGSRDAGLVGA